MLCEVYWAMSLGTASPLNWSPVHGGPPSAMTCQLPSMLFHTIRKLSVAPLRTPWITSQLGSTVLAFNRLSCQLSTGLP